MGGGFLKRGLGPLCLRLSLRLKIELLETVSFLLHWTLPIVETAMCTDEEDARFLTLLVHHYEMAPWNSTIVSSSENDKQGVARDSNKGTWMLFVA